MTKEQAINLLLYKPIRFAKTLGFDKLNELNNKWIIEMVRGKQDRTLQASRGTYKTTLDEHTQYIVNCIYGVSLKLTIQSATEISTNLTTDIKGTSQLVGTGIGSSLTGKHFDRIFTDDIVNVKDRISQAERENTKLVYQELQNIKNRGGKIFNTGTPWCKEDAFSIMPEPVKYNCYHPLIRQIISDSDLEHIRHNMSPSLFAANYELKHIADENVLFGEPKQNANIERVRYGVCHIDSAFYGEDFTAFTIMVYSEGTYYVLGKMWRKHVEDCYGEILNLYSRNACGKMYIEKNADKGMVARDLKNLGIRIVPYTEKMNKHIKISTYLKAIWENVCFVDGTDDEYINQICDYTEEAEHDDAPDSASCLARLLYPKIAKREGRKNIIISTKDEIIRECDNCEFYICKLVNSKAKTQNKLSDTMRFSMYAISGYYEE